MVNITIRYMQIFSVYIRIKLVIDKLLGIFLQQSGWFSVFISIDMAAFRIRRVFSNTDEFKRFTVDHTHMAGSMTNIHKMIAGDFIQIPTGRMAAVG